jgi:predicted nucleic acid-binding Zn ribbon protein
MTYNYENENNDMRLAVVAFMRDMNTLPHDECARRLARRLKQIIARIEIAAWSEPPGNAIDLP